MCYFHVMKNIKKKCQKPLSNAQYNALLEDIRFLHHRKSKVEYEQSMIAFKKKWDSKATI